MVVHKPLQTQLTHLLLAGSSLPSIVHQYVYLRLLFLQLLLKSDGLKCHNILLSVRGISWVIIRVCTLSDFHHFIVKLLLVRLV